MSPLPTNFSTWLWSTMNEDRLSNLYFLKVHKQMNILNDILDIFAKTIHRRLELKRVLFYVLRSLKIMASSQISPLKPRMSSHVRLAYCFWTSRVHS